MRLSRDGLHLLHRLEGSRDQVYDDRTGRTLARYEHAAGTPTIGVGHALQSTEERARFTPYLKDGGHLPPEIIEKLLENDVARFERAVEARLTRALAPHQFDALVLLAFNAGPNSRAVQRTTAAANQGDFTGAAEAIRAGPRTSGGRYVPGLHARRELEADLFLGRLLEEHRSITRRSEATQEGSGGGILLPLLGGVAALALVFGKKKRKRARAWTPQK